MPDWLDVITEASDATAEKIQKASDDFWRLQTRGAFEVQSALNAVFSSIPAPDPLPVDRPERDENGKRGFAVVPVPVTGSSTVSGPTVRISYDQWLTTSGNPCVLCVALASTLWPVGSCPSVPPLHIGCPCILFRQTFDFPTVALEQYQRFLPFIITLPAPVRGNQPPDATHAPSKVTLLTAAELIAVGLASAGSRAQQKRRRRGFGKLRG